MKASVPSHERSRLEVAELERGEVQTRLDLRVGAQHDLKATIEQEAVDHVGPHPSPDSIGSLEHFALDPGSGEVLRAHQTGEPRADDRDVGHPGLLEIHMLPIYPGRPGEAQKPGCGGDPGATPAPVLPVWLPPSGYSSLLSSYR